MAAKPRVSMPAEVTVRLVNPIRLLPAVVPARMVSQPVPTLMAFSVAAVPVKAPMLRPFKLTWASPVSASRPMMFAVFVPAVALPMVVAMFKPW